MDKEISEETKKVIPATNYMEAIRGLYNFEWNDMDLNFLVDSYSNEVFMQTTGRDFYIDFLKLPGTMKDGIHTVNAIRIHLPNDTAKELADGILRTITEWQQKTALSTKK